MSTTDGPRPASPDGAAPSADASKTPSGPVPAVSGSPSAGRFAELLAGMSPLERIERLALLETLSYGTVYEGRVFRASRAEPVSLLVLDPALEAGSPYPPIIGNLLAAARIHGNHVVAPRGLYRDVEDLYALYDAQPGLSLATGFEYLQRNGLRLTSEAVLRIASGVLQALDELEREDASAGTGAGAAGRLRCHGLLIPENLYVTEDQRVLVRGIGIWQSDVAKTGRLGPKERRYVAPVQTSSGAASARSDLVSLGAILFEAAAGFPAFDGPPTEDDLAEIVVRIDEIGAKAENSRRDLFGIAHACLSAQAVTPASRSRLRITVDTMFLREAGREKIAGCISLEELAGRVKAARPAIVKAVALDLDPVEAPRKPASIPLPPIAPPPAAPEAAAPGDTAAGAAGAAASAASTGFDSPRLTPAAGTASPVAAKRRFEVHLTQTTALWLLVAIMTTILGIAIYWISRPRPASQPEESFAAPEPTAVASVQPTTAASGAPSQAPSPGPTADPAALEAAESAGQREAALARPSESAPTAAPAAPQPSSARPREAAPAKAPPPRNASARPSRSAKPPLRGGVSGPAGATAAAPAPAPARPAEDSSLPPVVPGTMVELGTPGVIPPVVTERPEDPRFSPDDPRPASPGSVQLQLLVDERGRVLDHRILGASRFPPGVSSGVAAYIAKLRFKPAELRGVPVRVWIRHDMRFLAP